MTKTKSDVTPTSSVSKEKFVSARCHCRECGKRYVMPVQVSGIPKKGDKTETQCRVCKKQGKTIFLIFDKPY